MKVLIVEDEIFSANSLKLMVEKVGFEVVDIVNNAKDAIKSFKEFNPDMVLIDIMLKGNMSGCELALELSFKKRDLIIIFLTAYSDDEMVEYALDARAYAYLLKPYREGEIIATLKLAQKEFLERQKQKVIPKEKKILTLVDNYSFDLNSKKLFYKNIEVMITKNMETLLYILCSNANRYISGKELVMQIWNKTDKTDSLRSLVYRLKKITTNNLIISSFRKGYKINIKNQNGK